MRPFCARRAWRRVTAANGNGFDQTRGSAPFVGATLRLRPRSFLCPLRLSRVCDGRSGGASIAVIVRSVERPHRYHTGICEFVFLHSRSPLNALSPLSSSPPLDVGRAVALTAASLPAPPPLRTPATHAEPGFSQSQILSPKAAALTATLESFALSTGVTEWRLLYRGSRDGFEAGRFHDVCDGHSHTLTIVESEFGCVFGGYTPIAWRNGK